MTLNLYHFTFDFMFFDHDHGQGKGQLESQIFENSIENPLKNCDKVFQLIQQSRAIQDHDQGQCQNDGQNRNPNSGQVGLKIKVQSLTPILKSSITTRKIVRTQKSRTPEQRTIQRIRWRQDYAQRIAKESPEQRNARLNKRCAAARARYAAENETELGRAKHREKNWRSYCKNKEMKRMAYEILNRGYAHA